MTMPNEELEKSRDSDVKPCASRAAVVSLRSGEPAGNAPGDPERES